MKSSSASHALVVARTGFAVAALSLLACAADEPASGERATGLRDTALAAITASRADTTAVPLDEPLAVFIDGPTGFTFAWTSAAGWKFVGRMPDEQAHY